MSPFSGDEAMKTHASILVASATWLALASLPALAEPGQVFKLEPKPLPDTGAGGFSWWGTSVTPLKELPKGVSGVEALGAKLSFARRADARYELILTKSSKGQDHRDRLYLDANGDGKFATSECHDISRSHGAITVKASGSGRLSVNIRPLEVRVETDGASVRYWIAVRLSTYGRANVNAMYTSVTGLMGEVTFGDKAHLMAAYVRLPLDATTDFSQRVAWPNEGTPRGRAYMTMGSSILLDADGNGTFDRISVYAIGQESGRTTRLHRVDGAYWEVTLAKDGTSVRVAPAKPKVGTLAIPDGVDSGTVLGPEFGACFTGKDKQLELPAGRYVLYQYQLRTPAATLSARDNTAAARFEIRPGQTTRIEAGPPLTMKVTYSSMIVSADGRSVRIAPGASKSGSRGRRGRPPKQINVSLRALDRAGRPISSVWIKNGGRPEAPRFKILGPGDKTIVDDAFKYG